MLKFSKLKILSPPFEGGETFSNLCVYYATLRLTAMGRGGEFMKIEQGEKFLKNVVT